MVPASAKQTFSSVACEVHRPPYLNIGGREKREKKKDEESLQSRIAWRTQRK